MPLVLGIASALRGSISTAVRSARARPLNALSTMWWLFLPYSVSTWSVMPGRSARSCGTSARTSRCPSRPGASARIRSLPDQIGPARNVERDAGQRLVHRRQRVAVAADAALVAQRLGHRLADRDAGILGGVVLVDMEIADRLHVEVDQRVARQLFEHVIEEADAGRDVIDAGAVEIDGDVDRRLASSCAEWSRCACAPP